MEGQHSFWMFFLFTLRKMYNARFTFGMLVLQPTNSYLN